MVLLNKSVTAIYIACYACLHDNCFLVLSFQVLHCKRNRTSVSLAKKGNDGNDRLLENTMYTSSLMVPLNDHGWKNHIINMPMPNPLQLDNLNQRINWQFQHHLWTFKVKKTTILEWWSWLLNCLNFFDWGPSWSVRKFRSVTHLQSKGRNNMSQESFQVIDIY